MNLRAAIPIIMIVGLSIFATAFAMINFRYQVRVWPLPGTQPLTFVIGVSFLLGAGISGLIVHLVHRTRTPLVVPTGAQIDPR